MKMLIISILFSYSASATTGWDGKSFKACPDKPNCVSSTEPKNSERYIKPIAAYDLILDKMRAFIDENKNWSLVSDNEQYIHATYKSSILGFIDDIEFALKGEQLHIKSASRKGYYDFGANRKRIEKIKDYLN